MLIKKSFLVFGLAMASLTGSAEAVVRVALDVGSGGMKVTVADVDPSSQKINRIYYSEEHTVKFKQDMILSGEPRFSDQIQQKGIDTIAQLQKDLAVYQPVEWKGIATAASRQSENAAGFYEKVKKELGVDIEIISQEEEGRIGFETASAVSGIPAENIIAYDSGSGSFQLTTLFDNKLDVVQGSFGLELALSTLVKDIRGKDLKPDTSYNPVSVEEAVLLTKKLKPHLPKMPQSFADKLKQKETVVVGIGNQNYIFAAGAVGVGKNTFTKEELWKAILDHCGMIAQELDSKKFGNPNIAMVSMILLYTVMDGFDIDQITYAFANGSCEGLLIDLKYWNNDIIPRSPD